MTDDRTADPRALRKATLRALMKRVEEYHPGSADYDLMDHVLDALGERDLDLSDQFVTTSIEAAIKLTDRQFPHAHYCIGKGRLRPEEPPYGALIEYKGANIGSGEHKHLLACALVIAVLDAAMFRSSIEARA